MPSTWGPHLEIGVPEIDQQHKDIIETGQDLVAALAISERSSASRILETLSAYVLVHFETEERWMRRAGYPRVREHVAKHDDFIARIVAMTKDHELVGADSVLTLRLRNAIAWLEDHIEDDDRKLARHVAAGASLGRPEGRTP